MSKREEGYYWVKLGKDRTIGEFNAENCLWTVIGSEEEIPELSFCEIDENRITRPLPKKNKIKQRVKNIFSCLRRGK
jgi:hypothetical protein